MSIVNELFDLLAIAPAWLGPALAVVAFLALRYLAPAIFAPSGSDPLAKSLGATFGGLSSLFAPWAAVFILLVWGAVEIRKRLTGRLLDKQENIDTIRKLPWDEFERLVGEAYRRKGYAVEETGDAAGDGGVDLVLHKGDHVILVQCKQWQEWKVGVKPVRELLGVVTKLKAQSGILVTSGRFTQEAQAFAEGNPIQLLDGPALAALVTAVRAPEGPSPATSAKTAPKKAAQEEAPSCPKCGAKMVLRTAGKGSNVGKQFWGCPAYPKCHGTQNIE